MFALAQRADRLKGLSPWVWVIAVAALFSLMQLPSAPNRLSPDSAAYLVQVYDLLGESPQDARKKTIRAYCRTETRPQLVNLDPAGPTDLTPGIAKTRQCIKEFNDDNALAPQNRYGPAIVRSPTPITSKVYEDIFLSRPGVAVFYTPGVAMFGPRAGMWLTALACTLLGGVLVFLLLRVVAMSPGIALIGQILYYVLPTGRWSMAPLAEGVTLALVLLSVLGVAYVMTDHVRRGLLIFAAAFLAGLFVKYSQFVLLGMALIGTAMIAVLIARRSGRPTRKLMIVVAVSLVGVVFQFTAARLMGWPGGSESIQDLLTDHFRNPAVPDPTGEFLALNWYFWRWWLVQNLISPLTMLIWAVAAWALVRARSPIAFAVFAAFLSGLANEAGHPVASQGDRLWVVAYLLGVIGLPVLVHLLRTRYASGNAAATPSARPTSAETARIEYPVTSVH